MVEILEERNEKFDYILFLDLDGVVNHMNHHRQYTFLEESVEVLNELYKDYKYKIVLSSSWKNAYTFTFIQNLFTENHILAPLIDKTITCIDKENKRISFNADEFDKLEFDEYSTRDYEIMDWVEKFKPKHYIILDDFSFKNQELIKHHFKTFNWGINEENLALRKKHIPYIKELFNI